MLPEQDAYSCNIISLINIPLENRSLYESENYLPSKNLFCLDLFEEGFHIIDVLTILSGLAVGFGSCRMY